VEVAAQPRLGSAVSVALASGDGALDVHDLFVIAYG
jgi:hypothetical protein